MPPEKSQKIAIIGAGISGLAVGTYLQMHGFETQIFEQHSKPGGLCTSWRRGEYTFDGCIHWLLGSAPANPFYRLWNELLEMPSIRFHNHRLRMDIEVPCHTDRFGSKVFHLYTHLDELEAYLLNIAPEDARPIRKLIRSMRTIQRFEVPPMIQSVPSLLPLREKMKMITLLPFVFHYLHWKDETNFTYAKKFKNAFLREAFELLYDGQEVKLLILTMPLAFYDRDAAGYPLGGSEQFARRLESKYLSLGGKIHYQCAVDKILHSNGKATGLTLTSKVRHNADIIISAADWHFTLFHALDGKFADSMAQKLKELQGLQVYSSMFMVSLGIGCNFTHHPHYFRFPLNEPLVSPDGSVYNRFEVHTYNYEPEFAPAGRTVVALTLYTDQADYWIDLRAMDYQRYQKAKTDFAQKLIDIYHQKIGDIKTHIEVTDIATPATYHRYTRNWKGSLQGWYPGRNLMASSPVKWELRGLKNFYMTSHWNTPGGGLPVVVKSARDLAQTICHRLRVPWKLAVR